MRDRPLNQNRDGTWDPHARVLERIVAGVVIIGVLLWGASLLATPDDLAPDAPEREARDEARGSDPVLAPPPIVDDEEEDEEDRDDDEDEDRSPKRHKGKND